MAPLVRHFFGSCNGFSGLKDEMEEDFGLDWSTGGERAEEFTYNSPYSVQGIPYSGTLDM